VYLALMDGLVRLVGRADINMNVVLPCGHVAELQVHHEGIVAFEVKEHSHEHYEFFRWDTSRCAG
jgi:hypothetical protein